MLKAAYIESSLNSAKFGALVNLIDFSIKQPAQPMFILSIISPLGA